MIEILKYEKFIVCEILKKIKTKFRLLKLHLMITIIIVVRGVWADDIKNSNLVI